MGVGVVVIGRNEGERLRACLESLRLVESGKCAVERAKEEDESGKWNVERGSASVPASACLRVSASPDPEVSAPALSPSRSLALSASLDPGVSDIRYPKSALPVVYVDSSSTDGSVELARSMGAKVVELDMSCPFSAARARNEGFARVQEIAPETKYVQFVDGDCAVGEGWIKTAAAFLDEHPDYAVTAGRLRERFPGRSVYNRLCDLEWNTPVGDVDACGGIAMYRAEAFHSAGGFDAAVIAGEEPELCLRLRREGWKIRRLADEMASHDAAMVSFRQWWKRAVRGGYAYALGAWMHGKPPERHWVREVRSNLIWGLLLPLMILALAWSTKGLSLLLLCGYPVLVWRVYRHMRSRGFPLGDSRLYAFFCVLAKFPQAQGQLRFWWGKLMAKPSGIIEYKGTHPALANSKAGDVR